MLQMIYRQHIVYMLADTKPARKEVRSWQTADIPSRSRSRTANSQLKNRRRAAAIQNEPECFDGEPGPGNRVRLFCAPVIIAVTGLTSSEDRQRSKDVGIDNQVTKPAYRDDLMRLLMQLSGPK